jgi:hypothetical protein
MIPADNPGVAVTSGLPNFPTILCPECWHEIDHHNTCGAGACRGELPNGRGQCSCYRPPSFIAMSVIAPLISELHQ